MRYCADGGANRLYDYIHENEAQYDDRDLEIPDLIKGDLDSLKPHVRECFADKVRLPPVPAVSAAGPSQTSAARSHDSLPLSVLIIARLAGRPNHPRPGPVLHRPQQVLRVSRRARGADRRRARDCHRRRAERETGPDDPYDPCAPPAGGEEGEHDLGCGEGELGLRVDQGESPLGCSIWFGGAAGRVALIGGALGSRMGWPVCDEPLMLFSGRVQGKHEIDINKEYFGDTCAVLPVGEEAKVTTTGQEWDLGPTSCQCPAAVHSTRPTRRADHACFIGVSDMYPTSVAKCVSSSNHLVTGRVTVETDVPVVWTVEVRGGSQ